MNLGLKNGRRYALRFRTKISIAATLRTSVSCRYGTGQYHGTVALVDEEQRAMILFYNHITRNARKLPTVLWTWSQRMLMWLVAGFKQNHGESQTWRSCSFDENFRQSNALILAGSIKLAECVAKSLFILKECKIMNWKHEDEWSQA